MKNNIGNDKEYIIQVMSSIRSTTSEKSIYVSSGRITVFDHCNAQVCTIMTICVTYYV